MRKKQEIEEYLDEAFDRVWLVRKQDMMTKQILGLEPIDASTVATINKAIDEACERHNIDFKETVDDWHYGYWSGILAALRWVLGDEKDFLDT